MVSTVSTTQTFHLVEITPEMDLNTRHSRYTLSCFCRSWCCLCARTGHSWYLFCETAVKETPALAMADDKKAQGRTHDWQQIWYWLEGVQIRSDQISRSVVSDSLQSHESQHARLPCPSPTPRVHWDSRPSSQWCHPAISSSVVPFSSCPQSLPASESFPMSQLFTWGGQSTGGSALASFLPKKSQGWSPLEYYSFLR